MASILAPFGGRSCSESLFRLTLHSLSEARREEGRKKERSASGGGGGEKQTADPSFLPFHQHLPCSLAIPGLLSTPLGERESLKHREGRKEEPERQSVGSSELILAPIQKRRGEGSRGKEQVSNFSGLHSSRLADRRSCFHFISSTSNLRHI